MRPNDAINLASSYAFDSTWLSLLALQGAMRSLHKKNETLDINNTTRTVLTDEIMNQFKSIDFEGVTVSEET